MGELLTATPALLDGVTYVVTNWFDELKRLAPTDP